MPHDVYKFVASLLPDISLRKRKETDQESPVASTVQLLASQIHLLYSSSAMIAKGYHMAFVMLNNQHYKVKPFVHNLTHLV